MAQTPLYKKLRLEPQHTVFVLNNPRVYAEILPDLAEPITFAADGEKADFVHLFVKDRSEFDQFIDEALSAVTYDGLFWVSYPKGSSGVDTDINRDILWELMLEKGMRPVTQISIDDTWSALRYRPADKVGT
jgi:hypothetical protein